MDQRIAESAATESGHTSGHRTTADDDAMAAAMPGTAQAWYSSSALVDLARQAGDAADGHDGPLSHADRQVLSAAADALARRSRR